MDMLVCTELFYKNGLRLLVGTYVRVQRGQEYRREKGFDETSRPMYVKARKDERYSPSAERPSSLLSDFWFRTARELLKDFDLFRRLHLQWCGVQ